MDSNFFYVASGEQNSDWVRGLLVVVGKMGEVLGPRENRMNERNPVIEKVLRMGIEIRSEGHKGWGNTCDQTVEFMKGLQMLENRRNKELRNLIAKWRNSCVSGFSPEELANTVAVARTNMCADELEKALNALDALKEMGIRWEE